MSFCEPSGGSSGSFVPMSASNPTIPTTAATTTTSPTSRVMVRLSCLSQQLSYGSFGLPTHHSDTLQRVTEMMLNDDDLRMRVAQMVSEVHVTPETTPTSSPRHTNPNTHPDRVVGYTDPTLTNPPPILSAVSSQEFEEVFSEPFSRMMQEHDMYMTHQMQQQQHTGGEGGRTATPPPPPLPTTVSHHPPYVPPHHQTHHHYHHYSRGDTGTTTLSTNTPFLDRVSTFLHSVYQSIAMMLGVGSGNTASPYPARSRKEKEKVLQALSYVLAAGCMLILVRRLGTGEARKIMVACIGVVQRVYHSISVA
eukprot:PhF_6_TR5526/c0_g1_i2/m.7850